MPSNNTELEKNLWDAADELRANSRLRAVDYSIPVLGLIFLKYADHKFAHATEQFETQAHERTSHRRGRRRDHLSPDRYKAAGVLYLPDEARYQNLVQLPEGEHVGRKIDWRKRQQSRAAVRLDIEDILYQHLPERYTGELCDQKRDDVYHHVYPATGGRGGAYTRRCDANHWRSPTERIEDQRAALWMSEDRARMP